jgi:CubicO group peptidase (beta-lactamase class C family)
VRKKKNIKKIIFITAAVVLAAFAAISAYYVPRLLSTGVAYKAKILASGVFVSGREPASVLGEDLAADDLAFLRHINAKIDHEKKEVTADFFGLIKRKAVCADGMGCTLVYKGMVRGYAAPPPLPRPRDLPVKYDARLGPALDWAFAEPDPAKLRRTRAVVILHGGRIAAERYAPGFDRDTRLIGWSMTKSVMSALAGILVKEGRLSLDGPLPVPEWQGKGDPRGKITMDHLLHMSSGLSFDENYKNPLKDVTKMLFEEADMGNFAIRKELNAEPGSRWKYSSGTTNIVSRIIRSTVGDSQYAELPRRALFGPVGMASAVIERDATGTFVGSSYMYATARDWARFGQLYLQDGVWEGRRILPEGWVKYSATPAPASPDKKYGAHFWLKIPKEFLGGDYEKLVPADAFHCIGYEGQFVSIIPSQRLVVVRLGQARVPSAWQQDVFIDKVIAAIGAEKN